MSSSDNVRGYVFSTKTTLRNQPVVFELTCKQYVKVYEFIRPAFTTFFSLGKGKGEGGGNLAQLW